MSTTTTTPTVPNGTTSASDMASFGPTVTSEWITVTSFWPNITSLWANVTSEWLTPTSTWRNLTSSSLHSSYNGSDNASTEAIGSEVGNATVFSSVQVIDIVGFSVCGVTSLVAIFLNALIIAVLAGIGHGCGVVGSTVVNGGGGNGGGGGGGGDGGGGGCGGSSRRHRGNTTPFRPPPQTSPLDLIQIHLSANHAVTALVGSVNLVVSRFLFASDFRTGIWVFGLGFFLLVQNVTWENLAAVLSTSLRARQVTMSLTVALVPH